MFSFLKSTKKNNPISNEAIQDNSTIKIKNRIVESPVHLSIKDLENLTDTELYAYLRKSWNIKKDSPIKVWGYVSSKNNFYNLNNVKNLDTDKTIEYPISNLERETIGDRGIFIEYSDRGNSYTDKYITCILEFSPQHERKKKNNPLLLKVVKPSIEILSNLSEFKIFRNDREEILIRETIFNHFKNIAFDKLDIMIQDKNKDIKEIQEQLILLRDTKAKDEQTVLDIGKKEKELRQRIAVQKEEIIHLQIQTDKDKRMREENLKKIRYFIKSKADMLKDMNFITQPEYDKIMDNYQKSAKKQKGKFLDFKNELDGDYVKAISHIQAYLFNQDTVYYRYLIEDYFASIRTNDLIILAGDSGSGKTNLVKKFAEATGGVAKIIPVKPNWTSSDDLLGYYNPLQKSYLSTPFLDALLEAKENPDIPYFICLDEMNLARVEYYFADFLSLLEERGESPKITLYPDSESMHTISEFNHVLTLIEEVKKESDKKIVSFMDIMKDDKVHKELKKVFGFGDKDSLIRYHSDLRRMIGGILNTPSVIDFPQNVRIIGTINIDETTHYLSPKILDRAHIIRLDSPSLSDWGRIEEEIDKEALSKQDYKIRFNITDFGLREPYPQYNPRDKFCQEISELSEIYMGKIGIETSIRSVRQGLKYNQVFADFNRNLDITFNNFLLHKVLPKFTFDGNTKVDGKSKLETIELLKENLKTINSSNKFLTAKDELDRMIKKSSENDGLVNYWA